MPNTLGFKGFELLQHHSDHEAEFGTVSLLDYARMADDLWGEPKPAHVRECLRVGGNGMVRFDPTTDVYGVIDANRYIRTFFKPVPCVTLPPAVAAHWRKLGKCHQWPDNLTYFIERCK